MSKKTRPKRPFEVPHFYRPGLLGVVARFFDFRSIHDMEFALYAKGPAQDETLYQKQLRVGILRVLKGALTPTELGVVVKYYGLDGEIPEENEAALAREMGCTRQNVSLIRIRAIKKLGKLPHSQRLEALTGVK